MQKITFELRDGDEYIPLIALLKAVGIAESGSMVQEVVTAGLVFKFDNVTNHYFGAFSQFGFSVTTDYKIEISSF